MNERLQAANDFRHSRMELRCRADLRAQGQKAATGSCTVSQVGAEELLTGSGAHNITMSFSNRWWWAAEEEVSVVHEEQLPWCDGSMRSTDDATERRACDSRTLPDLTDPDSERGETKCWPERLVFQNGQRDDFRAPVDVEDLQKHMVTFLHYPQESELLSDEEEDNCREDDKDDTPDSSQESVNEKAMRRPVWVECEKQGQVFSKPQLSLHPNERRRDEYLPETMSERSRKCEWQRKTREDRLRHSANAQRIGEAKNPGPQERRKINDKIEGKLRSCNTGGAPGVFRMITKLQTMTGQKPLVVAMQEPKLSEASHKAVAALACSTDFFSYHTESKPNKGRWEGEERLQGGLLTLVRTDLQQRLMQKASEVAGTIMINVYSPPERCREELATLLCLTTEALKIGPAQSAMWMGDWNETEEETRKLTTTLPIMSTAQVP